MTKQLKHAMLDIETLALRKDALILSVGIRVFTSTELLAGHYWNVSPGSCGGVIDPGTVMWWLDQSKPVQDRLKDHRKVWSEVACDLVAVLNGVDYVWGNGVDFDNLIVGNALTRAGLGVWSYKKNMCYRTIRSVSKACGFSEMAFAGEKHDALADATHQAAQLIEWDKAIGMLTHMDTHQRTIAGG
jgi:hypothetical protein